MPAVDVQDVDGAACAPARADTDGFLRDPGVGRKPGMGRSGVAEEQPVAGRQPLQAAQMR